MKNLIISCLILVCISISIGYAQDTQSNDREKVEKNTSQFSLDYFSKKENSFYVLTAIVIENKIVIDEKTSVTEVPGKMPYEVGNFRVDVLDQQGERIAGYFMQDPMTVRTCEKESGQVTTIQKGTIQIPMPKSRNIAALNISRDKKRIQRLDVRKVMERFLKQQDQPGDNRN